MTSKRVSSASASVSASVSASKATGTRTKIGGNQTARHFQKWDPASRPNDVNIGDDDVDVNVDSTIGSADFLAGKKSEVNVVLMERLLS